MIDDGARSETLNGELLIGTALVVGDGKLNDTGLDNDHLVDDLSGVVEMGTLLVRRPHHIVEQLLLRDH